MPVKNYTTKIDVFTSLGEIQSALAKGGADKVMVDYNNGAPVAVIFSIPTPRGTQGFALPAPVEGTLRVFARQKIKADRKQAEKTAWRNVRDWVLAQMALVESCDVPVDQVFLPYLRNYDGATLYDVYANGQLRLEAGK